MSPFLKRSSCQKAEQSKDQEAVVRVTLTPSTLNIIPNKSTMGGWGVYEYFRFYQKILGNHEQVAFIYLNINGIIFRLKKGHQLSMWSINHIRNCRGSFGK